MRSALLWKIVAINAVTLIIVMVAVWLAVDVLAADYFAVLMERYAISPAESHAMFLDAIHRYLIQVGAVALFLAIVLSLLLTRQVLRPLSQMTEMTRRIAAGDLSARVDVRVSGEVGRLAQSFNRMSESLERLEELRRSMVVDIAHELRTPLTNIRGYLEALADGVIPPSASTLRMLQQEILRLVRLVEDLHQLTKADAARAHLRCEHLPLADLVDQALAVHRQSFERRGMAIAVRLEPGGEKVVADPDKLLQVLRNLIQNAWQHGSSGGRLDIAARRIDRSVVLSFANTGPPIPPTELPLLFERFHRVDRSRGRDSGGGGIGLAIVKELVEAHGGRVGAESGSGINCFWIALPTDP